MVMTESCHNLTVGHGITYASTFNRLCLPRLIVEVVVDSAVGAWRGRSCWLMPYTGLTPVLCYVALPGLGCAQGAWLRTGNFNPLIF